MGVDETGDKKQGAGDQGMMFGYASRETDEFMPMTLQYSHDLLKKLASIRKETSLMPYLGPDSKSQVTVEYRSEERRVGEERKSSDAQANEDRGKTVEHR